MKRKTQPPHEEEKRGLKQHGEGGDKEHREYIKRGQGGRAQGTGSQDFVSLYPGKPSRASRPRAVSGPHAAACCQGIRDQEGQGTSASHSTRRQPAGADWRETEVCKQRPTGKAPRFQNAPQGDGRALTEGTVASNHGTTGVPGTLACPGPSILCGSQTDAGGRGGRTPPAQPAMQVPILPRGLGCPNQT